MKFKKYMHSLINRLAYLGLVIVCLFFIFLFVKDANDSVGLIIGILSISIIFLFGSYLFIFSYKMFGKIIFYDDKMVEKGLFRVKKEYSYNEYMGIVGSYIGMFENKKAIILIPVESNAFINVINTGKHGNLTAINKLNILYFLYDEKVFKFLEEKFSE